MKNVLETKNITSHPISSVNFNEFLSLTLYPYHAIKIVFVLPGMLASCWLPSSGAGVVWVETSQSIGQIWPYNGDRT